MSSQFLGSDNPAMGAISDPLNFVKNLWGGMQVPGMVTPTVSVDELDKKIQDLKTVESWLNVNMTMLRGTIQALEVQRSTIATIKAMGETFAQQMGNSTPAAASAGAGNTGWPMPSSESAKKPEPAPEPKSEPAQASEPAKESAGTSKAEPASMFANPASLWTLLQDQFKQAVSSAMAGEQMSQDVKSAVAKNAAPSAAAKAPAKSAVKSDSKTNAAASTAASSKAAAKKPAAAVKASRKRANP